MLDVFSSGLVSVWLNMAGMPTSLDPWQVVQTFDEQVGEQFRAPFVTSDRSAETVMQQYLKQLASQGLDGNAQGIWIQSGTTLLASNQGHVPMSAASLTKVATSLAALQTWKIDHQFETTIAMAGSVENGTLNGDLIVQAGGDPMFRSDDAIVLGTSLNKLGITRVTGDLVLTGVFMMNFKSDATQAGNLLKTAIDSKQWDGELNAEFAALPNGTPRPSVVIAGKVRTVNAIDGLHPKVLLKHRSLPLTDLLRYMNVHSNNEMSQFLTELMGGSATMLKKASEAAGIAPNEIQFVNGSGLSLENRVSAHAACQLFTAIDRFLHPQDLTLGDLFPVSGVEGMGTTLEDRTMPDRSVVKTGTLSEVSALAGVVPTHDRGLVQFAIINRGTEISSLRRQQDIFLQTLQQNWGKPESAEMVQPSLWVKKRRSSLDASGRNEILYGG